MIDLIYFIPIFYFIIVTFLCVTTLTITIFTKFKFIPILALIFMIPISYFCMTNILSYPKYNMNEFILSHKIDKAKILYYKIKEPDYIFFLYEIPDDPIPRYYAEKFSNELYKALKEAEKQAGQMGGVMRKMPFFRGIDPNYKDLFYALPQPMLRGPKPPIIENETHGA